MRKALISRLLGAAILPIVIGCSRDPGPPNIILILTDDQGWSQLSGSMDPTVDGLASTYLETPNMNRILSEGRRFPSAYSPAPLCTPTRRSILCGTSSARSGDEFRSPWIPSEHLTIPRALKSVEPSYRCAHFGKWGSKMISSPEECGYDESSGMTGNRHGGVPRSLGYDVEHHEGPPHYIDDEDPKRTDSVTAKAVAFIEQQIAEGNPFYLQVSYYAQHVSIVCRGETIAKYVAKGVPDRAYTAAWAAMLEELDTGIGRILDAVDRSGAASNTYVFFTSDNGGDFSVPGGDESRRQNNAPLLGAKHSLYEGGIRVPFAVRGPGIAAGSICREPIVGYDLLPTFVELAGGQPDVSSGEVDGVSIRPLLDEETPAPLPRGPEGIVFHRASFRMTASRRGAFKLILHWGEDGSVARRELFDLSLSPIEQGRELSAAEPERVVQMENDVLTFMGAIASGQPAAK